VCVDELKEECESKGMMRCRRGETDVKNRKRTDQIDGKEQKKNKKMKGNEYEAAK
jgi:hypothetical protein